MHKSVNRSAEYQYYKSETGTHMAFALLRKPYLKEIFSTIKPKKVLVLGCGEGSFAQMIKSLMKAEVYGLDNSTTGVMLAKEKGIIAKKTDLNKGIPFPANFFDLIISDQLLEHIYQTDYLFEECHRVLRKGGYSITITPNLCYWMNRIIFLFGLYPIFLEVSTRNKTFGQGFLRKFMKEEDVMGHIRVFNLPALVDILESQKFKIINKLGIPLTFNLPILLKVIYDVIDKLFAMRTSLARDIMVVAKKN